jgi:hypothetical protein
LIVAQPGDSHFACCPLIGISYESSLKKRSSN